ncbi:hypothetical protein [Stakelama saccharophila]|uniref:Lipoprotein n=1 Tax=Stakelama saccharophila TaxID=3075605 RepID=A0ABZ0BAB6_9SPHN|nr:hypothetical protein [Stakelama sp. W311]WNO54214.1 hypothetical protein RPR59_02840 [Stakelama sp. W311]
MRIGRIAVTGVLIAGGLALSGCYNDRPGYWGDRYGRYHHDRHDRDHHHGRHHHDRDHDRDRRGGWD